MLVLTRRVGETVKIGDSVTITVLSVHGRQVQLGIQAPRSVGVYREELFDRINGEAARTHRNIVPQSEREPDSLDGSPPLARDRADSDSGRPR